MKTKKETAPKEVSEKSLLELTGRNKQTKYKFNTLSDYKNDILKMNLADLQSHAISVGLKPSRNRAMLEKNLIVSFSKYRSSLVTPTQFNTSKKSKELKVLEILSRGA